MPWLHKPVPPSKRGRITPLATQSQWRRLSVLILISIAWSKNNLADLHHYAQFPADIYSSLFWRTGVSFLPSIHSESKAPSSSDLSPPNIWVFLANLCFLCDHHRVITKSVSLQWVFLRPTYNIYPQICCLSGAHCTVIKQILEHVGFFTAFLVYCF